MPIVFMKRHRDFRPMYEWGEDSSPDDLAKWEAAFLCFLRKASPTSLPWRTRPSSPFSVAAAHL